jgi:tRNA nucleotidyltransferase (CCA-adding enzyme)
VRDELLDLLSELEAPAAVERMQALGIDRALHPALDADAVLVASATLGAAETGADRALAALAALCVRDPVELARWLDSLQLDAPARDAVLRAAMAPELAAELRRRDLRPSELHALLTPEPPEALALALALGAPPQSILRFLSDLRDIRLEISGNDLVAAGVPESPALGEALEEALRQKLDGRVSGRDEELRVALAVARRLSAVD